MDFIFGLTNAEKAQVVEKHGGSLDLIASLEHTAGKFLNTVEFMNALGYYPQEVLKEAYLRVICDSVDDYEREVVSSSEDRPVTYVYSMVTVTNNIGKVFSLKNMKKLCAKKIEETCTDRELIEYYTMMKREREIAAQNQISKKL